MSAPSDEYREHILELLEVVGSVRATRFFGGVGIYLRGSQFGMMMGNCLYFVVDDNTREKYQRAGMQPFSYLTKKGRIQVRRYFEVPEEVLSDREGLKQWAYESIRIASATKTKESKSRAKRRKVQ